MEIFGVYIAVLLVSAFLFSAVATGVVTGVLKRAQVMDTPNDRSNHTIPTPRGGGLAIWLVLLPFLSLVGVDAAVLLAVMLLAALSFVDDLKGLSARLRFGAQALAVLVLLVVLEFPPIAPFLPRWLELMLMALAWLWFINLFNFMDGADGLAASEAVSIAIGAVLLALVVDLPSTFYYGAWVTAGAVSGFLLWNWPRAKIFLGDVGSVPLGFLLGYGLLQMAGLGYWAAALILPAVFVADASYTLLCRAARGERLSQAHSSHCYQRAIRGGMSHRDVLGRVIEVNAVLIALAVLSAVLWPWQQVFAVLAAYGVVFGLLWRLAGSKTA